MVHGRENKASRNVSSYNLFCGRWPTGLSSSITSKFSGIFTCFWLKAIFSESRVHVGWKARHRVFKVNHPHSSIFVYHFPRKIENKKWQNTTRKRGRTSKRSNRRRNRRSIRNFWFFYVPAMRIRQFFRFFKKSFSELYTMKNCHFRGGRTRSKKKGGC